MFSGIIKHTAKAKSQESADGGLRYTLPVPYEWETLEEGESINIDGICSTVESIKDGNFRVFYMPETLKKTSLRSLNEDHIFNLERCLTLNDLIGGHLVYGHVDAAGRVARLIKDEDGINLFIEVPEELTKYMVYKGSVSLNGVSLTIVSVTDNTFSVSLIPYTLEHTNLSELSENDLVNIEVDMMAKHIEKLIGK